MRITRRVASSSSSQCSTACLASSRVRASSASSGCGPVRRSRSHRPSASRPWRSGASPASSASVRSTAPGVQEVGQVRGTLLTEQLGEQLRVEREGGRAPLGQRRVAVVQELGGVAEQERLGEGRGSRRRDLHDPDAAGGDLAHEVGQRGDVEVVLQALAGGFQHYREVGELAGHLQQLGGPLALLPQGLSLVGPPPGEQQRASRGLAEPRREHHRRAQLVADRTEDLVRVQEQVLERDPAGSVLWPWSRRPPGRRRPCPTGRRPSRRPSPAAAALSRRRSAWRPRRDRTGPEPGGDHEGPRCVAPVRPAVSG